MLGGLGPYRITNTDVRLERDGIHLSFTSTSIHQWELDRRQVQPRPGDTTAVSSLARARPSGRRPGLTTGDRKRVADLDVR